MFFFRQDEAVRLLILHAGPNRPTPPQGDKMVSCLKNPAGYKIGIQGTFGFRQQAAIMINRNRISHKRYFMDASALTG